MWPRPSSAFLSTFPGELRGVLALERLPEENKLGEGLPALGTVWDTAGTAGFVCSLFLTMNYATGAEVTEGTCHIPNQYFRESQEEVNGINCPGVYV